MANYLANVAARALNNAPFVRPRLRGRFDPPSTRVEKLTEESEISAEPPIDQMRIETGTMNPPTTRPQPVRPSPFDVRNDDEQPVQPSNKAVIKEAPEYDSTRGQTPSAFSPTPNPPHSIPSRAPVRVENDHLSGQERALKTIRDEQADEAPRFRETSDKPVKPPATDPVEHPGVSAERVERLIERETRVIVSERPAAITGPTESKEIRSTDKTSPPYEPKIQSVAPVIQPRVEQMPELRAELPSAQQKAIQPEPTVHVTIGRIEVRAVQQQQTAAKPRVSQPVMNLDEYLRQRSRGGAR